MNTWPEEDKRMDSVKLSDEELVQQIQTGEKECLEELYARNRVYIEHLIFYKASQQRNQNPFLAATDLNQEVEDLIGEVLCKIFDNIDRFDPSKSRFKTWASNIAVNHVIDWAKKKRLPAANPAPDYDQDGVRSAFDAIPSAEPSPFSQIVIRDAINQILGVIQGMDNDLLKTHLVLRFMLGISESDIAAFMGVTESSVRSNICRSLGEFRKAFVALYPEYSDTDFEALAAVIREGILSLTEAQITRIQDPAGQRLIKIICTQKHSIKDISSELNIPAAQMNAALRKALRGLLSGSIKRRVRVKVNLDELSEREQGLISSYIDLMLSGNKAKMTRAALNAKCLAEVKGIVDLIVAATCAIGDRNNRVPMIGDILLSKAEQKGISYEDMAKTLSIDIHTCSRVFNNDIPPDLKENREFRAALAQMTELSQSQLKTILDISHPSFFSTATRRMVKHDEKLKTRIAKLIERKYPAHP